MSNLSIQSLSELYPDIHFKIYENLNSLSRTIELHLNDKYVKLQLADQDLTTEQTNLGELINKAVKKLRAKQ
jgi:hypothetical protein